MSIRSPTYQQSVFKRYHSDKHFSEFHLQDGGKNQLADMEQNYVISSDVFVYRGPDLQFIKKTCLLQNPVNLGRFWLTGKLLLCCVYERFCHAICHLLPVYINVLLYSLFRNSGWKCAQQNQFSCLSSQLSFSCIDWAFSTWKFKIQKNSWIFRYF